MVVGSTAERPMVLALARRDGQVVDARDAALHEALLVELPVLVAVGPEPVARIVMPLIGETYRDAVSVAGPELLDEPVIELPGPLPSEELLDRVAPGKEFGAIAPHAVARVCERHALWIPGVP